MAGAEERPTGGIPPTPDLEVEAARLLLRDGIAGLTFGRLSRATGVSDRMLVYRFGSKSVLVERALQVVSAGLRDQLGTLVDAEHGTPSRLLAEVTQALTAAEHGPVLAVWFEVLAGAARQDRVCAAAAQQVAAGWHAWLTQVLAGEPHPEGAAGDLLVKLEGALVLHTAGLRHQASAVADALEGPERSGAPR